MSNDEAVDPGEGRGPGRPSKFTPDRIDAILLAIGTGSTKRGAAAAAGISPNTFYAWLHRDPEFVEAVARSVALNEQRIVEVVTRAAVEGTTSYWYAADGTLLREERTFDWRAAAWLLEHHRDLQAVWSASAVARLPNGSPM